MLSFASRPDMQSVVMLNVVLASVVALKLSLKFGACTIKLFTAVIVAESQ
jgi:hypothetical protein